MRPHEIKAIFIFLMMMVSVSQLRSAAAGDSFSPLSIKLNVVEPIGLARTQEPVTAGIPLPKMANISDVNTLKVVGLDGVTSVPAQFQVLSRWDGPVSDTTKPIKWVLVDFQADVAANLSSTYYLKSGGTGTTTSGISVTTDANSRTAFKLFSTVDLGSGLMINGSTDGIVITYPDGTQYSSANIVPTEVVVETTGTLHTVIRIRGKYSNGSTTLVGGNGANQMLTGHTAQNKDMEYLLRLHFYKNKSYVRMEQSLINNGNAFSGANNGFLFNAMALDTTLNLGSTRTAMVEGVTDSASVSDQYSILQTHSVVNATNESVNFSFSRTKNGSPLGSNGTRATGYIDLSDANQGLTVSMRYFWQNFPKGFRINGSKVSVDLFPNTGTAYFNRGGQYKTHDLLYNFHRGSFASSLAGDLVTAFQNPLAVHADPKWYADTQALGLTAPSGLINSDSTQQSALDRFEQLQRVKYNAVEASNGKSLITYREKRELNGNWYGWNDFGDILHNSLTGVFSGVGYDWPYSLMLHYLRTGNRPFLDLGMDMITHQADLDVDHGTVSTRPAWDVGMDFRMGGGGHYATSSSEVGITEQNQGQCLAYVLTGEQRYLDTCKISADSGWAYWTNYLSTSSNLYKAEMRLSGWIIFRLLTYYKVSGDVTYLNNALTVFTNGILAPEQSAPPPGGIGSNGQGYVYDDLDNRDCTYTSSTTGQTVSRVRVLMLGYITDPLVELHRLTGSTAVKDYLVRMLNFVRTSAFVGGTTDASGNYLPYQTPYCYDPATGGKEFRDIQVIYNYFFTSGYAYLYAITHDPSYLSFSRSLFKDSIFYWEAKSNTYINPASKTPVYLGYEPQTAKQQGWTGRFHQGYLAMEYQLMLNGGTLPSWYPSNPPGGTGSDSTPPLAPTGLTVK